MKPFTHKDRSEVDIRVAQEIQNNRNFMYETNQKLNSLSSGMIAMSVKNEKILNEFKSYTKSLQVMAENLNNKVEKSLKFAKNNIDNLDDRVSKQLEDCKKLEACTRKDYCKNDEVVNMFKSLVDISKQQEMAVQRLSNEINSNMAKLESKLRAEYTYDIQKLWDKPSETKDIYALVDNIVSVMENNLSGVHRELEILKRSCIYNHKKFESLHTVIQELL